MIKKAEPYSMTYVDLVRLSEGIEKRLSKVNLGQDLHDIGSPLACFCRDFVSNLCNEYYKTQLTELNTNREQIANEVRKDLMDVINQYFKDSKESH